MLATVAPRVVAQEASGEPREESAVDFTYSGADLSLLDLLSLQVVSASQSAESVARAPAVIDVITADDIERYGYRDLAEALESLPGLDVTHDHYQASLGVRGVTGGQRSWSRGVKVMIDGQPIAFRSSGENFLGVEGVPLQVVERIEVIRGPGSVLYGANAFLAVVNVITKEGYQLEGGHLEGGYEGGQNIKSPWGGGVLGADTRKWSVVVSAVGQARELYDYPLLPLPGRDVPNEETSESAGLLSGSAYGRLTYRPDETATLSLDGHFQTLNQEAEFMDWGPMAHENQIRLRNGFTRLSYDGTWGDRLHWRLAGALAFGSNTKDERLNPAANLDTFVDRDLGYAGRDMEVSVRHDISESGHVSVGVDSSIDTQTVLAHYVNTREGARILNPPGNSATGEREFLRIGAYTNSTLYPFELAGFAPLEALGVVGGVRLDSQNLYGENFNARAGVVYDVDNNHYVKLLYGSSYRAPASTQLFSNYIEPGGIIGNPELRPERARTFEIALGVSPLRGTTFRLNAFHTRILERVEIQQPAPSSPFANRLPTNSSPIDSFGGEATVDVRFEDYSFFANYSLQVSSYPRRNLLSIDAETVDVATSAYPSQMIKIGASADLPEWFARATVSGRWIGARLGTIENNSLVYGNDYLIRRYELSPYFLVDVSVSSLGLKFFRERETRFVAKVRNLFDSEYAFPGYGGFDIPGFARSYELVLRQEL